MRAHYWRMLAFVPYFDSRLAWFPEAWAFKDLYAVYPDSAMATEHPDWILRDGSGRALYIPYKCGGGRCPQYAGDVGSPAFRAQWIAEAVAGVAPGYPGIFVSDVTPLMRVSDGNKRPVRPIDPRTGGPMTQADWGRYVAEFCEQMRAALPGKEIVHDTLWYVDDADPSVQREIASADFLYFQRGFNDPRMRRGRGGFGFGRFLAHVDRLHGIGKGVVYESKARTTAQLEFNLAGYLLLDAGGDGVGSDRGGGPAGPARWWSAYDVALGDALGPRSAWRGVLRRDFANGMVLVNGVGASATTLALPGSFVDLRGRPRTAVTLAGARGAVLRKQ